MPTDASFVEDEDRSDELTSNASDKAALALRFAGVASSLGGPFLGAIGPIAAELVGNIIPNQRHDRLARLLRALEARLTEVERKTLEQQVQHERFVDVIEDGLHQAVRALSQERLDYIASLLKNSLNETDMAYTQTKWMLWLLGQLNDAEIIMLKYRAFRLNNEAKRQFYEQHAGVLTPPAAVLSSPTEVIDQSVVHRNYLNHMISLGLLQRKYKMPKKNASPEFDDDTGTLKAGSSQITYLGQLLLRHIDEEPDDTGTEGAEE